MTLTHEEVLRFLYWPEGQKEHMRLLVEVGGVASTRSIEQFDTGEQTRLDVVVGARVSYCNEEHVVST